MRFAFLLFSILILFVFPTRAQVTFQKLFGHPQSNVAEFVLDATLDNKENFYIVGTNILKTFHISKIDTIGQIQWMKTISAIDIEPRKIIFTSDSCLLISGRGSTSLNDNYFFIVKIDTACNVLWSRYLLTGSNCNLLNLLFEDQSGNYIIGGYQCANFDTSQLEYKYIPFMAKFDVLGNSKWIKRFQGIYTFGFNDGGLLPNGNYLLTGFVGDTLLGDKDVMLLETDTIGNWIRSMAIGSPLLDIGQKLLIENNNIIIASNDKNLSPVQTAHFISLDSSWSVLKNRKNFTNGVVSTYDMIPYINNTYLISANGPMLYLLDSTLKITLGKNFGNSNYNRRLHKTFHIGEGRVVGVGTNGQTADILMLKTDSVLNPGCNDYTTILFNDTVPPLLSEYFNVVVSDTIYPISNLDSIVSHAWYEFELCNSYTGLENSQASEWKNVKIYPNPVNQTLNVTFENSDILQVSDWEISDFSGRKLAFSNYHHFNNYETSIDVSFLSNGNYILKIETNEKVFYLKFIVNR